jgi:glycosyltransferase involved in cell wall biosynthesis
MPSNGPNNPIVSVLLPVYNGQKTIGRAIQSIIAQTYPHWELLILNDGSTDQTVAVVFGFKDPRVKLLGDNKRRGIGQRLNEGIAEANGHYIARMDADDIAVANRFEEQISYLNQHLEIDLLGGAMLVFDNHKTPLLLRSFPLHHHPIVASWSVGGFLLAHPTWMGRTDWFRRWQYWNYPQAEDQELLLRSFRYSIFANLPIVLIVYSQHQPSTLKKWRVRWGWLKAVWKNQSGVPMWIAIAVTIIKIATDWVAIRHRSERTLSKEEFDYWSKFLES